jgi:hypothetical protein
VRTAPLAQLAFVASLFESMDILSTQLCLLLHFCSLLSFSSLLESMDMLPVQSKLLLATQLLRTATRLTILRDRTGRAKRASNAAQLGWASPGTGVTCRQE